MRFYCMTYCKIFKDTLFCVITAYGWKYIQWYPKNLSGKISFIKAVLQIIKFFKYLKQIKWFFENTHCCMCYLTTVWVKKIYAIMSDK